MNEKNWKRPRLLIEDWLPIAALGEESVRERRSMTALPPTYYLHVWWARRPLVASRAAVLASLLPADADREMFLHMLGIHGDPVETRRHIELAATQIDPETGKRKSLGADPYGYRRAFTYGPNQTEIEWLRQNIKSLRIEKPVILDPTAGGGSIPLEAFRLGCDVIANDLNPVAWLILKATVEFPARFGTTLIDRYKELSKRFLELAEPRFCGVFPEEKAGVLVDAYLWARTITCPYCEGVVPLSPNWRLNGKGAGVRLVPDVETRRCRFEIVHKLKEQSPGTVKRGTATCPYPDCGRVIDGDEIKQQAQAGQMGQQLYAVIYKEEKVVGRTNSGKAKVKKVRGFRSPRPEDDVEDLVRRKLEKKLPEWQARNIIPDEEVLPGHKTDEARRFGITAWRDMFAPRQLYGHCTSVEVFHDLVEELQQSQGELSDLDRAALSYVAFAISKILNYNAYMVRWHSNREVVAGVFDRHDFSFKWSFAEMAPTVTGLGYDWAVKQTGKALDELIELLDRRHANEGHLFAGRGALPKIEIVCQSADHLLLDDGSVDAVVMDPPYYDNVMYAELADFFYVWLKRTAGLLFPEPFQQYLTDKDREAVANVAKFKGQKRSKDLAQQDYERRMAAIFRECSRVLKPAGLMTVMFTHKSNDAWDALTKALVDAGFVIEASWPSETEAGGSLHIKEKAAAKSTIFLVCRVREKRSADAEPRYWEDVEPKVAEAVLQRVEEFQKAGIAGIDLYLASFGPALQVFSEAWPLTRGRALQEPLNRRQARLYPERDPYAVVPEDALLAARRVVKDFRLRQLASARRSHLAQLDMLTEWYILAWDSFRAPKFEADEALKLARVVGLDFDKHVKNEVCEVKGSNVTLWDSKTRQAKGKLGSMAGDVMLDALHQAAVTGRDLNTGAVRDRLEKAGLLEDPAFKTALEALLNVLPPPAPSVNDTEALTGFAADFVALERLRRLAFREEVPAPKVPEELGLEFERALEII